MRSVEPKVGGVPRREWRRLVQRSRLPSGVKLTLLEHASLSRWHWHNDLTNEHGIRRDRLANSMGVNESTVRRHLSRAEAEGWLARHRNGNNGRQQSVFHYVTPSANRRTWCLDAECLRWEASREASREARTTPKVGRQDCLPYVLPPRHDRDEISGAARSGPDHALTVAPRAASTHEMNGWPTFHPGHRSHPLTGWRASVSAVHHVASPSRVRHLSRAMA